MVVVRSPDIKATPHAHGGDVMKNVAVILKGALAAMKQNDKHVYAEADAFRVRACNRDDVEVTAKLFLNTLDPSLVTSAISELCSQLGITYIDVVVLAVNGPSGVGGSPAPLDASFLADFTPVWKAAAELKKSRRILNLGLADFGALQLEQLVNHLGDHPDVNQVNIDQCCLVPRDLNDFAMTHGITLLTHSDPVHVLPSAELDSILREHGDISNDQHAQWLMRHSSVDQTRGVVLEKGWLLGA